MGHVSWEPVGKDVPEKQAEGIEMYIDQIALKEDKSNVTVIVVNKGPETIGVKSKDTLIPSFVQKKREDSYWYQLVSDRIAPGVDAAWGSLQPGAAKSYTLSAFDLGSDFRKGQFRVWLKFAYLDENGTPKGNAFTMYRYFEK